MTLTALAFASVLSAAAQAGAVRNADTAKSEHAPTLTFTFDDLPAHGPLPHGMARPEPIRSILSTLQSEHMPPVYGFVNGFRVARFPYQIHILQAWQRAGQPLGNHTWEHPELDRISAAKYTRDIARNEPLLRQVDPHGDWHWFRYPYLEEGNTVEKREAVRNWLFAHQYRIAEVSMDFQDYNWNDAYARCARRHDTAAIAHLHDTYLAAAASSATAFRTLAHTLYGRDIPYILLMHVGAFDAHMLPELIAQYRSEGFQFIPLEQASADPIYNDDPRQTTTGGATFLEQVAAQRKVATPPLPDDSDDLAKICR